MSNGHEYLLEPLGVALCQINLLVDAKDERLHKPIVECIDQLIEDTSDATAYHCIEQALLDAFPKTHQMATDVREALRRALQRYESYRRILTAGWETFQPIERQP